MRRHVDNLGLDSPWGWGSAAAVFVVALIFLGAGSTTAALVCLACALVVAGLAWRERSAA